ncbi:COG3904 family protein [Tropicimonas aquimaris]|uniref:Lipoprotein n=1 Tax=Tropicimonas aquimaris TaxID=914152 RepID=A0ABW3IXA7_9RHOB
MKDGNLFHLGVVVISALTLPATAQAAEVTRSQDIECRVEISGPIERGDFEKLSALEKHLVVQDGESTSDSVVCLDSPGGSVTEGLKMAAFFLEKGVSTRIRAGAECHSICAIMFMMGNYRGSEVAGLSRRMHATARLGFHRPYLTLEEAGSFTSGEIEDSYDFGVSTIFEFLTLANQREPWGPGRMIEPDLMQRITGTPGDDLFYISTVEHALHWDIGIDGVTEPKEIGSLHLLFACENALAAGVSLTTELAGSGLVGNEIFGLAPVNPYTIKAAVDGVRWDPQSEAFEVTSLRSGYSNVTCEVVPSGGSAMVCGTDEQTNIRLGECGTPYGRWSFASLAFYHPATELRALPLIAGNAPEAVKLRHCQVFDSDGALVDDDPCIQQVLLIRDGKGPRSQHLFDWPSGSRTVVEIEARDDDFSGAFRLNGSPATSVPQTGPANCILNTTSGNVFCISDY